MKIKKKIDGKVYEYSWYKGGVWQLWLWI